MATDNTSHKMIPLSVITRTLARLDAIKRGTEFMHCPKCKGLGGWNGPLADGDFKFNKCAYCNDSGIVVRPDEVAFDWCAEIIREEIERCSDATR